MDRSLVGWARAVKARRRGRFPPPLWLFTDPARTPDLDAALQRLPRGLCGVVFRHDGVPNRPELLRRVGRICRRRGLALAVAGERSGAPAFAGRHLRAGSGGRGGAVFLTSSAHSRAELVRARRAGAALAFVSPAFPTESHPGGLALGPVRWGRLTRAAGMPVMALGGVSGRSVRRLPAWVAGVGAIGALLPGVSPLRHSVSQLPCRGLLADCGARNGAAILPSGLADPARTGLPLTAAAQGMGRGLECPPGRTGVMRRV